MAKRKSFYRKLALSRKKVDPKPALESLSTPPSTHSQHQNPPAMNPPPDIDAHVNAAQCHLSSEAFDPTLSKTKSEQCRMAANVRFQKKAAKKRRYQNMAKSTNDKKRIRLRTEESVVETPQPKKAADPPKPKKTPSLPPASTKKKGRKRITDPALMSERTLCRRKAEVTKELNVIMPGARITMSPPKTMLSAEQCVELITNSSVSFPVLRMLRTYGIIPSITKIYKTKHALLAELPVMDVKLVGPEGKEVMATCVSLIETLSVILEKPAVISSLPPGPIKVTLTGDAGGTAEQHSTKICFFLNDMEQAISVDNLILLACFPATDSRPYLADIFPAYMDEMTQLKNGLETSTGVRFFEFFIVVDLKTTSTVTGHQGNSSLYFCQFCLATKAEMQTGHTAKLRTLQEMREAGVFIQANGYEKSRAEKQKQFSVFGPPLVNDEVTVVPPIMHVMGGVFNMIFNRIDAELKQDDVYLEMWKSLRNSCGVEVRHPAQELLAKDATLLAHAIVDDNEAWVPYFELIVRAAELLLYGKAEYYCDELIEEFAIAVEKFFVELRAEKGFNLTPKCHILEKHVVPFFREFKSWSRFSEQSIECLHSVYNRVAHKCPGKTEAKIAKNQKTFAEKRVLKLHFMK